jgi:TonB-linked SusC/RagA family outer membrane protein
MAFSQLWAQTSRTVTGKVTDEQGAPIASASVQAKGTKIGTLTNADGSFSLNIPTSVKRLVVSSLNFETQEFAINGNTENESLKAVNTDLTDVVVVGYGSAKKVGTVVGSVDKVDAAKLQNRPNPNILDALQGQVAGLQVFTSSGEPSATPSIRLHGITSLSAGSTPLFVMDGIPIETVTVRSLNPNDFESVTVLKDASATSIYGTRASAGVVYITTKKGSANRPATINLETQYGVSSLANTDFFSNFMTRDQLAAYFVETGQRTQAQINTTLATYPGDTKWYQVYYKDNVPMFQANLSISGGAGKTTYFISGGYLKQEGVSYRSGFKRYTLRSNITTAVNDWFRIGLNLVGGHDIRETNPYGSNSTNRGLALLAAPWFVPNDPATGAEYQLIPGWGRYHPHYLAENIRQDAKNLQLNPSGFVELKPIKNLTLKAQAGIEAYDERVTTLQMPSFIGSLNNGNRTEGFNRGFTGTITNTAEYKFDVKNRHKFTVLAGQEYIEASFPTFSASSTGQTDDRLVQLAAGPANRSVTQTNSEYSYNSYFSRLEYNLDNKYFIDLSGRQDQASRFGRNNRTANFWSAGIMWRAKQEDFFSRLKWLNDLTIRTNIGTSGNSQGIGNYDALGLVGASSAYDNATGTVLSSGNPGNPDLGWEKGRKFVFGVNFLIFNKAKFEIEYYNRKTSDMLLAVPYAYISGVPQVTTNIGAIKNTGIDINLEVDVFKSRNAYITPYVKFNYNRDKVTELFQGKNYWNIPNTYVTWAVGKPVSFFSSIWAGVNPANGNPQWYVPNANPDDRTTSRQDPNAVTSTFVESDLLQNTNIKRYPPYNGGFGLNAGLSGFKLSADFSFSQGKYLFNNDRYFFENPNQFPGFNQSPVVMDYWKKAGDVTRFPKNGIQFTQFDSRLIENASFIRLKNISLSYDLPGSVLGKTKVIKSTRFYVTGRNLLTWTKYTGPDPEIDTNLTLGANPNTKQIAVGLNMTF